MVALTWVRGLLAHRRGRLLATALGVAVGVALLASIGTFLSSTTSQMTGRAISRVPVAFADTTGLQAVAGGSTQQTGPGRVLGLPAGYARAFPGEIRVLAGRGTGVLLAQQTAANLHARPGGRVRIGLPGG